MKGKPAAGGDLREIYSRRQLAAIAARWDDRADSWDDALQDAACHLNEDDAYHRFIRVVQRRIAQRRRFCASHGVIDMGCGTGLVLAKTVSAFAWGIGIDLSLRMICAARARGLARAQFIVGDCFQLPSICPKAGAVLSRGVLLSHYGREHGQALLEAARATLAPGGFVVLDFLNEAARTQHRHAPENKSWFTSKEIQTMANRTGFSAVSIAGQPTRRVLQLVAVR